MNKRIVAFLSVAAILAFAVPAQAQLFVEAGATFPTSDFGDFADTGWMALAGYEIPLGDGPFGIAPELFYGSNGHSDSGDKTNLFGANAALIVSPGSEDASVTVFFFGTLGYLSHKFSPESGEGGTDSGVSFGGGAGLGLPAGLYLEGRFLTSSIESSNTTLFAIMLGWFFG